MYEVETEDGGFIEVEDPVVYDGVRDRGEAVLLAHYDGFHNEREDPTCSECLFESREREEDDDLTTLYPDPYE